MKQLEMIVKLRETTGAGVLDCRRALESCDGSYDRAVEALRASGAERLERRSGRETAEGRIAVYNHGGRIGAVLELRCETDFVARNESFIALAEILVRQVAAMNPESVEELLTQSHIRDGAMSISELISAEAQRFGENVRVERFCRYEL